MHLTGVSPAKTAAPDELVAKGFTILQRIGEAHVPFLQ